jgi:hypothetical protein
MATNLAGHRVTIVAVQVAMPWSRAWPHYGVTVVAIAANLAAAIVRGWSCGTRRGVRWPGGHAVATGVADTA